MKTTLTWTNSSDQFTCRQLIREITLIEGGKKNGRRRVRNVSKGQGEEGQGRTLKYLQREEGHGKGQGRDSG